MTSTFRPKVAILLAARTLGLFALSRYLTKNKTRILCYHGGVIGDEVGFNSKLFCSAEILEKRVDWLQAKGFQFVTLDDALKQPANGRTLGRLPTVITFDDGWYSTASQLLPVLSNRQVPSTLYLSTEDFLRGWPIIAVTVRYAIWKAQRRHVAMQGWGQNVDGDYDLDNATDRTRLAERVVPAIVGSANGREQACGELTRFAHALGVSAEVLDLASRRFDYVTAEEVLDIAKSGCSIESHGHAHQYLGKTPGDFSADLRRCENIIVALGLPRPRHYCYPSGCFSDQASITLKRADIHSATTCIPGLVDQVDDACRHYLPRFLDGNDIHDLEFEAEMSGFSDLMRNTISFTRRIRFLWQPASPELVHADA
jgi:peptidoglycan/xylan/chitin deacetylase (PgdA/CDA1 family)